MAADSWTAAQARLQNTEMLADRMIAQELVCFDLAKPIWNSFSILAVGAALQPSCETVAGGGCMHLEINGRALDADVDIRTSILSCRYYLG